MNVSREPIVVILSSPSLLPNNLSAIPSLAASNEHIANSGRTHFATVSHNKVGIFSTKVSGGSKQIDAVGDATGPIPHMGNLLDFKEIVSKDNGTRACAAQITQATWVEIGNEVLLVVTSYKGIQMYNRENDTVFWHALNKAPSSAADANAGSGSGGSSYEFARGIACINKCILCIGTSLGDILTFKMAPEGKDKFIIGKTLTGSTNPHAVHPITDMHSPQDHDGLMVSADEDGRIALWKNASSLVLDCRGKFSDDPCNSVRLRGNVIAGGYAMGKIRLFSSKSGQMLTEIDAHAKTINAIDLSPDLTLISTGEDTFFRIWKIQAPTADEISAELAHSDCLENMTLTGCCFLSKSQFAVTAYDYSEIHVFTIK